MSRRIAALAAALAALAMSGACTTNQTVAPDSTPPPTATSTPPVIQFFGGSSTETGGTALQPMLVQQTCPASIPSPQPLPTLPPPPRVEGPRSPAASWPQPPIVLSAPSNQVVNCGANNAGEQAKAGDKGDGKPGVPPAPPPVTTVEIPNVLKVSSPSKVFAGIAGVVGLLVLIGSAYFKLKSFKEREASPTLSGFSVLAATVVLCLSIGYVGGLYRFERTTATLEVRTDDPAVRDQVIRAIERAYSDRAADLARQLDAAQAELRQYRWSVPPWIWLALMISGMFGFSVGSLAAMARSPKSDSDSVSWRWNVLRNKLREREEQLIDDMLQEINRRRQSPPAN